MSADREVKARGWSVRGLQTEATNNCLRKACNCRLPHWMNSPTPLSVPRPHPHFPPPVPGSVLFDRDQLQRAYSSFYHLSQSAGGRGESPKNGGESKAERCLCRDRGCQEPEDSSMQWEFGGMQWGEWVRVVAAAAPK